MRFLRKAESERNHRELKIRGRSSDHCVDLAEFESQWDQALLVDKNTLGLLVMSWRQLSHRF